MWTVRKTGASPLQTCDGPVEGSAQDPHRVPQGVLAPAVRRWRDVEGSVVVHRPSTEMFTGPA